MLLSLHAGMPAAFDFLHSHGPAAALDHAQNLLTFCFTKMYFYCTQINDK